jgi:hypothetical protein
MEAILQAAPNSAVQLYAFAYWPAQGVMSNYGQNLVQLSVFTSFLSVGLSFSMFEQKVQARSTAGYVCCAAVMRMLEIASRSTTLALFAALYHPYGFWWALFLDYVVMVCLTVCHKSVRSSYSLFLSLPLVLMSYEPIVWRRQDHVVPKDRYYVVRVFEFVILWLLIAAKKGGITPSSPLFEVANSSQVWPGMMMSSWCATLGLFATLPCIYRVARKHELARDGGSEANFNSLEQEERDFYSDSGSDGRDWESEDADDDLQAEDGVGLLSGQATQKEFSEIEQE